ncbi:hypothetical protein [Brevibacterium oceani]|uniref:hypothetical protein n=1 Tax=Brevibacterium oceani TaxID=358099 RepID=UPI0015E7DE50|nr:hypothetical protein [Brevibacterium oceani]
MTAIDALPELWTDWCYAAGVAEDKINETSLMQFSRQARPSKMTLSKLRRAIAPVGTEAPAWPREHRADSSSLHRLISRTDVMIQDWTTSWPLRLRLRRMLFAAVLVAPSAHGGLGLNRAEVRSLRPADLEHLRDRIGVADDTSSCPACAVWSWLEIIGTNNGWSQAAVRSLAHRRDGNTQGHRHELPDTSPDWRMCIGMLPSIDRWGWIDGYSSVHPSSLSMIINAMSVVLEGSEPVPAPEPKPRAPVRELSYADMEAIFARADEVTARAQDLLREYG